MSYKTEKEAREIAKEVKDNMHWGLWRISVWENLGWHCCIGYGFLSISIYNKEDRGSKFMLLVGHGGSGIGRLQSYHGDDANKLAEEAINGAITGLKYYTDVAEWLNIQKNKFL